MQQFLAVIAVFGMLGAALWWLRRRGLATVGLPVGLAKRRQSGAALQAVERVGLTPTHSVHLVRAGDRAILLACSQAGCQVVETAPWSHYENRGQA